MPTRETHYPPGARLTKEHTQATAVLIPHQMDLALYQDNCSHPDPRQVAIFARGEFPDEDPEKQVILASWLPRHVAAWEAIRPENIPVTCFGLDLALSLKSDATVLTAGSIDGLREQVPVQIDEAPRLVEWIFGITKERYGVDLRQRRNPICVDMDGLGKPIGQSLREAGAWVIDFIGNSRSEVAPHTYANMRAEAYSELGARLSPEGMWAKFPFPIPPISFLHEELCAPEKVFQGQDGLRYGLMPKRGSPGSDKQSVMDKIGRSPDLGDSAVYFFTAVRIYYQIANFMASLSGPLTVWPPPEFDPTREVGTGKWNDAIEPGTREKGVLRHPIRDWQSAAAKAAEEQNGTPPEQTDLLAWLERYRKLE